MRTDYLQESNRRLDEMTGPAIETYRQHVKNQGDRLQLLSTVSQGLSVGYDAMSVLVTFVHSLVRDAIAQIVGAILSYVAELVLTLGAATPLVIHQATTRVSALVSEVVPKIQGLTRSGQSLDDIMSTLRDILNDIPRFLGSRYSVPNHPGLRWNNVLTENGSWIRRIPGYEGATVADQLQIIALRRRYAHLIRNDPALWDKVVRDATGRRRRTRSTTRSRRSSTAAERQLGAAEVRSGLPARMCRCSRTPPPSSSSWTWSASSCSRSRGRSSRCVAGSTSSASWCWPGWPVWGAGSSATCSSASPRRSG